MKIGTNLWNVENMVTEVATLTCGWRDPFCHAVGFL